MTHIIGQGTAVDPQSLDLHTRARWRIPNELRELEKAPATRAAAARIVTETYQTARVLSTSALYNCAGLVFGSRRVVIDVEHAERILRDDGYKEVEGPAAWRPGDIVVYRSEAGELTHVAVVHSVESDLEGGPPTVMVISAWGESGEYLHEWSDVQPLLGSPSRVWSKRLT